MRKRQITFYTSIFLAVLSLSGCGIKGPLQLPDADKNTQADNSQPSDDAAKEEN